MNIKSNKGISLIVLLITIIVLIIIAGIIISSGRDTIERANLETSKTNMLLIRAKAKEYCEQANFKIGTNTQDTTKGVQYLNEIFEIDENYTEGKVELDKLSLSYSNEYPYSIKFNENKLRKIGLNEVANSNNKNDYVVGFNIVNNKVEVFSINGYKSKDGNVYHILSELENIDE